MVKHENVITFYGTRKDGDRQYLFLEYACGGELFDRIGIYLIHLFLLIMIIEISILLLMSSKMNVKILPHIFKQYSVPQTQWELASYWPIIDSR